MVNLPPQLLKAGSVGTEVFEGCLQMTQPRQQGVVQDNMSEDNGEVSGDWNDAKCSKKRGYVCEFCHDSAIVNP